MSESNPKPEKGRTRYESLEPPPILSSMVSTFANYAPRVLREIIPIPEKEIAFLKTLNKDEWAGIVRRVQNELSQRDSVCALVLTEITIDLAEEKIRTKGKSKHFDPKGNQEVEAFLEETAEEARKNSLGKGKRHLENFERDLLLQIEPRVYTWEDVKDWLKEFQRQVHLADEDELVNDLPGVIERLLAGNGSGDDAETVIALGINFELESFRDEGVRLFTCYLEGDFRAKGIMRVVGESMIRLKQIRTLLRKDASEQ